MMDLNCLYLANNNAGVMVMQNLNMVNSNLFQSYKSIAEMSYISKTPFLLETC